MTPDATRDTTEVLSPDTPGDTPDDTAAYVVTITEAARLTGQGVRTIQRRLDADKYESVMMAGKRCVKLPTSEVLAGLSPDASHGATHDTLDSRTLNKSRDVSHANQRDSGALAVLEPNGRGIALIAAVVRETLNQAEERHAAPGVAVGDKLLLTLAEAQALTGLSRQTLRAAIDAGELKARQIGRPWRVKRGDLEKYVAKL